MGIVDVTIFPMNSSNDILMVMVTGLVCHTGNRSVA